MRPTSDVGEEWQSNVIYIIKNPLSNSSSENLVVREWQINKKTFELEIPTLESMLNEKTSMVAFTHCSNLLGTINPVEEYIKIIRKRCPKAIIVVDGVALAAHRCVDVQKIDADFYVFSIYKTFGPHIAALHGKRERMEALDGINHFYVTGKLPQLLIERFVFNNFFFRQPKKHPTRKLHL